MFANIGTVRSFLLVPADDEAALLAARAVPADALILDGGDSVAPDRRERAHGLIAEFLADRGAQSVWVRLAPGGRYHDIALLRPDGFVLPGIDEHDALYAPDALIALAEKEAGLTEGTIKFMVSASDEAEAVLNLDTYHYPALPRLAALTWDARTLALGIGAAAVREEGAFTALFQTVRTFTLMAAKAASAAAVEAGFSGLGDHAGLACVAREAVRDGFTGMTALHPEQVEVINAAFTPTPEHVERAKAVLAGFAGNFGSYWRDGRTYDDRHLKMAQRIVALAEAVKREA